MPFVKTDSQYYTDIADAIRAKHGVTTRYFPAQMASAVRAITGKEDLSWHQCPEAVRNYLTAAAAVYSDTNVTVIDQYAPSRGNEVVANTKPVGYSIAGVTFYDNEPLVATPFATQNKAGTLTALDRLRWINTTPTGAAAGSQYPRGINCRDLGGWACDGGTIKYGMLVRGSEPNPADKELMVDKIGIKTEVQLLPLSEQAADYKMKSAWGIDWAGNDTESTSVYTLADSKTLWEKLLEPILDSVIHAKPVYFHCGVGADRTGMIASALEGLLGVNRADIDMEYELTNFAIGWQSLSGGIYRARTYSGYVTIMNQLANVPLLYGLTDTFRNRWVSFVLSCGISIDKINAFRAACIDGSPDVIVVNIPTYTITKSGSNVVYDNDSTAVSENDSYSVGITPADGYVISDVEVTMGGTDITSQVFSGTPTVLRVSVTNNLSNCTTSNNKRSAVNGEGYVATITADSGYTLDGATVQITMGGADVSQYYSNGTINIPSVTGNIVITATAVPSAPAYTNWIKQATAEIGGSALYNGTGYKDGYRLNSTGLEKNDQTGSFITGYIPVQDGDTVHFYGDIWSGVSGGWYTMCYAADGSIVAKTNPHDFATAGQVSPASFTPYDYDSANHVLHSFTIPSSKNIVAIRFTLAGSYVEGTSIVTVNETVS